MSTAPQPVPDGERPPKRDDPVEKFKARYGEVVAQAKVSSEHTMTEGWRALYLSERNADRKARTSLCERLKGVAAAIEDVGSTEDLEKALGDVKKDATTLRTRREAFDKTTVDPVRRPVDECRRVIEEAKQTARRIQDNAPLLERGMEDRMNKAISGVAKPEWDEDNGTVTMNKSGAVSSN